VLDDVDDDDYLAALRPLLKAKWPTIKGASDYERSMKLINMPWAGAFEMRLIRRCVAEMADVDDSYDDD
jgi:regulatory protein